MYEECCILYEIFLSVVLSYIYIYIYIYTYIHTYIVYIDVQKTVELFMSYFCLFYYQEKCAHMHILSLKM
jgi:hypothetical protein